MDDQSDNQPETSPEKQSVLPFVLMMIWFGVLIVASLGLALLGLAFAGEPGGRGNPGFVDYMLIFGPLVISIAMLLGCIFSWVKGKPNWAVACCIAPILVSFITIPLFGI